MIVYTCYLMNSITSISLDDKTLIKVWFGKPRNDYDSLHMFCSITFFHVKEFEEQKSIIHGDHCRCKRIIHNF